MWNTYSWPKRMVNVKVEKIDTWSIYGNWSLVKKHIFPNGGEFFMVMFIPWDRTASVKKVTKKLNKSFTLPETNITPPKNGWNTTFLFYFQGRAVSFRVVANSVRAQQDATFG